MVRRWSSFALLLMLVPVCGAQDTPVQTSFRLRYVGTDSVYVDGGRSAGLAEGMRLVIKAQPGGTNKEAGDASGVVAYLKVMAIAETSAMCEVVSQQRALVVGDIAVLEGDDAQKLIERRTLSNTRQYPAVVSFTEGDPLDEDVREQVPRPPLPEVNRAVGRIGFDYSGVSSPGQRSSLMGMVLRTDITRIGGTYWNLSGYWRGTLESRSSALQPTLQDLMNRTYHLTLSYANPNSRWLGAIGRMYLPFATSLDSVDGGYFGRRLSKTATIGLFAGTTPDPTSWSYNPDRRIAGTFTSFEGGDYSGLKYATAFGAGISTLRWQIDRPFAFEDTTVSYRNAFSLYSAIQLDRPRTDPALPSVGLGVGRSFFSIRVQPHPWISFDLNHIYFRDVPTFDPQLVGTGLLDKYLFQGFSGGVRVQLPRKITLYENLGRSNSSHDARSSWNVMSGLSMADIWHTGLTADVHFSRFNSAFAQGSYRSLSLSRNFGERLRLELLTGTQSFSSSFSQGTGSHFFTSNVDLAVRSHYFLEGGLTAQRGGFQNYSQWYIGLGYRFDNRHVRKEAFNAAKP